MPHELFFDWSEMDDYRWFHEELFKQLELPKSQREDFGRPNVHWVTDSFSKGTLPSAKPPYRIININVSLAPYAHRDDINRYIDYLKIVAADNSGSEIIIREEGLVPTIRSVPDPTDIDRDSFIRLIACSKWPILENENIPPHGPARDNELKRLSNIHDQFTRDFVNSTTSPGELHLFVKNYDWDQRYIYLMELIQNPSCDLNTALLVFWLSGADYFQRHYKKAPSAEIYGGYHRDAWHIVQQIKKNVVAGKYKESAMPEDFKKEVVIVPEEQQLWPLESVMYGDVEANAHKRKVTEKKGLEKKQASSKNRRNSHHACMSSKSQLQLHLDLLQGKTDSNIQYFLGTGKLLNGSSESHDELEASHVTEEVAISTYSYTALHYGSQDKLTEIREYVENNRLPDYKHSPKLQEVVETEQHAFRKYMLLQPYEFTPNKRGLNKIGGSPPTDFVVPKLGSGLAFQYLGLLNHSDPTFKLRHDFHMVYPLYIEFSLKVWLDYQNPLEPLIMNDKEISELTWVNFKEGEDIVLEPISFKTVAWPTKTKHGGHTGVPNWIQGADSPTCPKTNEPMDLICQLGDGDLAQTEMKNSVIPKKMIRTENFGASSSEEDISQMTGDGDLYIFFNRKSRVACYMYQGT